jgi:hypothetical protein
MSNNQVTLTAALYQGLNEHYVDLYVGTPPQRQTVVVSTGAHATVFPCSFCDNCGRHTDPYFQERASMTYSVLTCDECSAGACRADTTTEQQQHCTLGQSYQEGSVWAATEGSDYCSILGDATTTNTTTTADTEPQDSTHAFFLTFGCQTKVTGVFRRQLADGTLSMSRSPHSFWNQLYRAGKIQAPRFSLCYSRNHVAETSGALTLGGTDERLHTSPMVYTPLLLNGNMNMNMNENMNDDPPTHEFVLDVRKVHFRHGGGGDGVQSLDTTLKIVTLEIPDDRVGQATIESGYSNSQFSSHWNQPFRMAWYELTGDNFDHQPTYVTYEQIQLLPTILIQLVGDEQDTADTDNTRGHTEGLAGDLDPDHPYDVLLALPPNHYMEYDETQGLYVPRFHLQKHNQGSSVLGANTIMGHDVLFDAEKNRIGWAESRCDYSYLVDNNPNHNVVPPYYSTGSGNTGTGTGTGGGGVDRKEELCRTVFCETGVFFAVSLVAAAALLLKKGRTFGGMRLEQYEHAASSDYGMELQETTTRVGTTTATQYA